MNRIHHWMMTICLVMMGVAMVLLMWRAQPIGGGVWLLLLPMGLCLGLHLFVHRHSQHHDE
ncbi:hypothetical protein ACQKE4_18685 [Halomonas sp. NPDC076908]|uniref:hypothetical protein n=1 Tax=Halomonas sp. NPDC076908 TaxID=3390567 RepID=UPI003CFC9D4C